MASHDHSLPRHMMQTPPEVLAIAGRLQAPQAPQERLTRIQRFWRWIRPRKGCGCQQREAWLNAWIPGLGTLVRWFTTITGIRWLVKLYYSRFSEPVPSPGSDNDAA